MKFQRILLPVAGAVLVATAYRAYGWAGVAFAGSALVMWALLHFNRALHVLRRAAQRPIGFVDSAVMLNAKLKEGVSLLHVMALTRSIGVQQSAPEQQPEVHRWTDGSGSSVTCEFVRGRLVRWELLRPAEPAHSASAPPSPAP